MERRIAAASSESKVHAVIERSVETDPVALASRLLVSAISVAARCVFALDDVVRGSREGAIRGEPGALNTDEIASEALEAARARLASCIDEVSSMADS